MSENIFPEDNNNVQNFLQIKSIRTSSHAYLMKLKEGDIIVALDGNQLNKTYEELSNDLQELKDKKILTLLEMVYFSIPLYMDP